MDRTALLTHLERAIRYRRSDKRPKKSSLLLSAMCKTLVDEGILRGRRWITEQEWRSKSVWVIRSSGQRTRSSSPEAFRKSVKRLTALMDRYFDGKEISEEFPKASILKQPSVSEGPDSEPTVEYKLTLEPEISISDDRSAEEKKSNRGVVARDFLGTLLQIPTLRWDPNISPPGALLRADIDQPVPFHGREEEIADFRNWCLDDQDIAVRLYTGPGGFGKTRLLVELCRKALEWGWRAGFFCADPGGLDNDTWRSLSSCEMPVLIVVDYAETRRDELTSLIGCVLAMEPVCVRFVLLARAADDWWGLMKSAGHGVGELLSGPASRQMRLSPLADTEEHRRTSYKIALQHFAEILHRQLPRSIPVNTKEDYFDRILLLHMAALACVEGVTVKGEDGILDYVLRRERRFWVRHARARGISDVLLEGIGQSVGVLTLGGGAASQTEARKVLKKVPLLRDQPEAVIDSVSRLLHDLYAGSKWIEPIQPDLLGEHLVEVELEQDMTDILDVIVDSVEL